jgi:hypothetical protein
MLSHQVLSQYEPLEVTPLCIHPFQDNQVLCIHPLQESQVLEKKKPFDSIFSALSIYAMSNNGSSVST